MNLIEFEYIGNSPKDATHKLYDRPYKYDGENLYWWNDMDEEWVKDHFNRDVSQMAKFYVFGG